MTRGGASFRIDWDVRTAYDFIFSLSGDAGSTDDLPAEDRTWLTDTRKALPQDVQDAIGLLFESELAIHAGVLLVDQPDVRTSADVVALVESTGPTDLVGALFAEDGHDPELADLIRRAIDGDPSALPALSEKLPDWNRKGRIELLRDPVVAKERILAVLRAWHSRSSSVTTTAGPTIGRVSPRPS